MPIWIELVFLLLAIYVLGLGIGWLIWGRGEFAASTQSNAQANAQANESEEE